MKDSNSAANANDDASKREQLAETFDGGVDGCFLDMDTESGDVGWHLIDFMDEMPEAEAFARIRQAGFIVMRVIPGGVIHDDSTFGLMIARPEMADEINTQHEIREKESIARMANHWYDI